MHTKLSMMGLLLAAVLGLGLSACNTVEGAGRDIQHAGAAVEDAAQ
jgi:predicted small secreted protein